jgi:tRNA nucleotidyltransferase (CCA-adding enzyme)
MMMLNSFLPSSLYGLLAEIEEQGYLLCLVGGAVRDYSQEGKLSHDLDFEIRCSQNISDNEWPNEYERFVDFLKNKKIQVTSFPYLISKIDFLGWSLEFSSPREEFFEDHNIHTHHNFSAILSSNLSYHDAFKRRDFTINAMGFEFSFKNNSIKLIDPYSGAIDLAEKRLKIIDDNFFKDSVRFLRMIRFKIKYRMFLDSSLEKYIGTFNLSSLSKYHFTAELFKTEAGVFLHQWNIYISKFCLEVPDEFKIWSKIPVNWQVNGLASNEDILVYIFLNAPDYANEIQNFFAISKKTFNDLKSFHLAVMELKKINKENTTQLLKRSIEDITQNPIFQSIKIVDDKKIWREKIKKFIPDFEKDMLFKWEDWNNEKLSNEEMNMAAPPLRTQLRYLKALKKWVNK